MAEHWPLLQAPGFFSELSTVRLRGPLIDLWTLERGRDPEENTDSDHTSLAPF